MSATIINGTSGGEGKMSNARPKAVDGRAADEGLKRASPANPWKSGVNPITQRSSTPARNGAPVKMKAAPNQDTVEACNDRLVWLLASAIGSDCQITAKNGQLFSGIFAGASLQEKEMAYLLKMTRVLSTESPVSNNASASGEYIGTGPEHEMKFAHGGVASLVLEQERLPISQPNQNGPSSSFRTDKDISGNTAIRERKLQRWDGSGGDAVDMSLEPAGEWDQFKANERFGFKSDYHESYYTTTIDTADPSYAQRARKAEKIAREIEQDPNSSTSRTRNKNEEDLDEEDKYSGVRRAPDFAPLLQNQPNKYLPPGRRADILQLPESVRQKLDAKPVPPEEMRVKDDRTNPKDAEVLKPSASRSEKMPDGPKQPVPRTEKVSETPKAVPRESGSASKGIEQEVLQAFQRFTNSEKLKINDQKQAMRDQKRAKTPNDRAMRLNDLKKFSQSFKLNTPIPRDLVPILAKNEEKQKEIVQKAERDAEVAVHAKPSSGTAGTTQPGSDPTSRRDNLQASKERLPVARDLATTGVATTGLGQRLADSRRMHKATMPTNLNMQESSKSTRSSAVQSGVTSPVKPPSLRSPSAKTLNVRATEFRPNPNASTFRPSQPAGSSNTSVNRLQALKKTSFWAGNQPPSLKEVPFLAALESFTKRAPAKEESPPKATTEWQEPYRTPPTWTTPVNDDSLTTYKSLFPELTSPPEVAQNDQRQQQRQQPPYTMQMAGPGMPHGPVPGQMVHPMQHPPHHFQNGANHFDRDPNAMRPSASSAGNFAAPSPRIQNGMIAYQSPIGPHGQIAYPQPIPFVMTNAPPTIGGRQFSNPNHLTPVMVPQGSMQGFPPQAVAYNPTMFPHGPMSMYPPTQPPSQFPSPGRNAPLMARQGSHQSQSMYMPGGPPYPPQTPQQHMRAGFGMPQPAYGQSPYQQHHQLPHQPHRTPSNGFAHAQHAAVVVQGVHDQAMDEGK